MKTLFSRAAQAALVAVAVVGSTTISRADIKDYEFRLTEPTVAVTANPAYPQTGASSTLQVTASDPDGSASDLQLKWDDDYDGTWDTAWAPVADRVVVNPAGAGPRLFKARVRDATGRVAEAVVRGVWSDLPPDAGTPDSGAFIPADASA